MEALFSCVASLTAGPEVASLDRGVPFVAVVFPIAALAAEDVFEGVDDFDALDPVDATRPVRQAR
jgi:hypothetical protein